MSLDDTGALIVVGQNNSLSPRTTERAFDRTPETSDAILLRLSADGAQLLYSTLLGGASFEGESHMAYVGGATVIVAGRTKSPDFPVTAGALDTIYGTTGAPSDFTIYDVFVAKMTLQPNETGDTTVDAPALVAPAHAATFTAPAFIDFDWSDVSDASGVEAYHIQISPNAAFADSRIARLSGWFEKWIPVSQASADFGTSFVGTFYWRVQTLDRTHNLSAWSAVRTFTVSTPTPPASPTLTTPANNAQLPPSQAITFAWNAVSGASSYDIQIDDSSAFTTPLVVSRSVSGQTQTTQSFASEKSYWWRARAINGAGAGAWSTVRTFQIKKGASLPPPPGNPTLSTLTINPTTVTGGASAQATVTLTSAAPASTAIIALTSSNSAIAAVPASVTVAAGATSATFTITTNSVTAATSVSISASYGGITRTAPLTVNPQAAPPPPTTDTVAIQRADYSTGNRQLRVEATSTNSSAVLTCYVTSTNQLIGTLTNSGGRYSGQFSLTANPQSITVKSSLGGKATRAVTIK
ncbi:MAG: hypothetical protein WKF30_00165 [Pyrinomonadaceae bacterium]